MRMQQLPDLTEAVKLLQQLERPELARGVVQSLTGCCDEYLLSGAANDAGNDNFLKS